MTNDSRSTRRRILQVSGGLVIAGLAGCLSGASNNTDPTPSATESPDEQPTGTATESNDATDGHADENGHDHDEGLPDAPSHTAEVALQTEETQQHYDPHIVWIEEGGTVTWENESGQHNAVAYHPDNGDKPLRMPEGAEPWSTELLADGGETATHTFSTEGVYDYYCTPHEYVGMVGTVIVGEPDPHDQPGLEDPQSSLPEGARTELAKLGEQVNEILGHTH